MILRIAFSLLGVAALAIGAMIFLTGPQVTGQIFVGVLQMIWPETPSGIALSGADVDSEMRFYAVLWMAYGGMALWVARALPQRVVLLRLMLCIFLLGGVGRAMSHVMVGAPHLLFSVLMWIEIALPPPLLILSLRTARGTDTTPR